MSKRPSAAVTFLTFLSRSREQGVREREHRHSKGGYVLGQETTAAPTRVTSLRIQRVLHDFSALLAVTTLDDHSFRVSTPFSFANGDMFPIVLESHGTGWRITDRGGTIANLTQGHIELAQGDIDLIETIAYASGYTLSGSRHISADFDDLPSPRDIASLIQLEACISALASATTAMSSTIA
jgi:Domain of unknown function DUF1828